MSMMASMEYDLTEVTRILLEMRDNCLPSNSDLYNDPKRMEKANALAVAITLLNNPSLLRKHDEWQTDGIAMKCSYCNHSIAVEQGDMDMNFCPHCGTPKRVSE